MFIGCLSAVAALVTMSGCSSEDNTLEPDPQESAVSVAFGGRIDLDDLDNYAAQTVPAYISKDNSSANPVTDAGATLGRVLFYDRSLSSNNSVACASCHHQDLAFGDPAEASMGVNGTTARHSMRLVNTRFANEVRFFWDERAATLEDQTTQPIQDHTEMGFSGADGDPNFADLITRLESIDYYNELFVFVYGDDAVTEERIQLALGQFVRSIQSFDSRYDEGRAQAPNDDAPFANYTPRENMGKDLFLTAPQFGTDGVRTSGGLGCAGCHQPPEFDIDPATLNNGVTATIDDTGNDFTVTRAPSLRDVVGPTGSHNGGFFHTGITDLSAVVEHYNNIALNPNLDPRLMPNGQPQNLALTTIERSSVVSFLQTLSGVAIYTDVKWSDPFVGIR